MGGKGQKGAVAGNDQIVAMQQQQAAQATQANQERTARLNYGKQNIQNIFEGTLTGAQPLDLSSITQANAKTVDPATLAKTNAAIAWGTSHGSDPNLIAQVRAQQVAPKTQLSNGYSWGGLADDGSGTPQYGIFDSSGNLVNAGSLSDIAASKIYAPGSGAGAGVNPADTAKGAMDSAFGDTFYNKYRQSILDYYSPQEAQQYSDARSSLAASLARAGQLDSSTATMDIAKLSKQDQINQANIASNADTQTGSLRTTIAQNEQSALNQLYSTEDPSVAANTAENMVANANLTKPLLNPAGALFAPLTVGVGNALSGFLNPTAYINPNASGAASTASGASGSGSTQNG